MLSFTTLPTSVTAGSSTELQWTGGDDTVSTIMLHRTRNEQSVNRLPSQGVTITLQQGTPNNFKTVQIVAVKSFLTVNEVVH